MSRQGSNSGVRTALGRLSAGLWLAVGAHGLVGGTNSFVNFETAPVHPVALSPDGTRLAVCNLPDGRLEVFDVTAGLPTPLGSVPVGLDPVSVRFRSPDEVWVVNHISDSISVVDVPTLRTVATIQTLDTPADVIFAGSPVRAFVSCALPNTVQVFDPATRGVLTNLVLEAERPKALAASPDGREVYAAIFESGNATTIVGPVFQDTVFASGAVSLSTGPYHGANPPPNNGPGFRPPLNPANGPPPRTGIIVRKNGTGRWMDDNRGDWTEFVSGTNAALTKRVPGWDLPDRDLAVIDTMDLSVAYATGLMNLCMDVAVDPASGRIAVVGTDAINEVRFEPNLNGIFVRVKIALVDPLTLAKTVLDLNPHLDYTVRALPAAERDLSIGDPRGIVWNAGGTRAYVAGMGSRNLLVLDAAGGRARRLPIELEEGPTGLALDEARERLYVLNRFSSSLSTLDTATDTVLTHVPLFDPTPRQVRAGRRHLYDTRRTSGLGQASCASCHPDARMDRLAWDLGDPAGAVVRAVVNTGFVLVTNVYHPMKGVMVTQTFQDIIGHEPFHWRGDRPDLESFNQTFTNLMAAPAALSSAELKEFKDLLATIHIPPNPYRTFANGLSTKVSLTDQFSVGDFQSPPGLPLGSGNAVAGFRIFASRCTGCHTVPAGLGRDTLGLAIDPPIPTGTNGGHHVQLATRLEGGLLSKIAQLRNLPEKVGMDGLHAQSRAGFGFGHDGSVDSLPRFFQGLATVDAPSVADLAAFLLSFSGSDLAPSDSNGLTVNFAGPPSRDVPAALGRQLTLDRPQRGPLLDAMLALAGSSTGRVDLIAKGMKDHLPRGWLYDPLSGRFQSDRLREIASLD